MLEPRGTAAFGQLKGNTGGATTVALGTRQGLYVSTREGHAAVCGPSHTEQRFTHQCASQCGGNRAVQAGAFTQQRTHATHEGHSARWGSR
jgi:hypothetical protein